MRFDIHFRQDISRKIQNIVNDIKQWNQDNSVNEDEIKKMSEYVVFFEHCSVPDRPFIIGGADGSGEFPVVSYNDSYIYLVVALSRIYESSPEGLKEIEVTGCDLTEFLWLPEDQREKDKRYKDFFTNLIGIPLIELCKESDYLKLRSKVSGQYNTPDDLINQLILPAAHDAGNISIQILSTAELCSIVRVLKSKIKPTYLLADTTLTLPLIKKNNCLFFELVKRYCCKLAREKGVAFFALSKSHTIPHIEQLEEMIERNGNTEHWYLRIPTLEIDGFRPKFLGTRGIPPVGAVTYIFRLHKNTPPMRLDMDLCYWKEKVWSKDKEVMAQRERRIFRDLDFTAHDQRSFGYPYPIKASHDMVSLTKAEKEALRNQIIDAAERVGLKRRNFLDPSVLTGHR